jgi:hypothetical protein
VTMLALFAAGARPVARQPLLPPPPPEDADDETKRRYVSGAVTGLCTYLPVVALACVDDCGVHTPRALLSLEYVSCAVSPRSLGVDLTSHVSLH